MVIIILCDIVVCLLFAIVVVGIRIHKKKRILKDSLSHGFKMIEISPFKKNEFKQFSFKLFDTAIMGSNPKESDIIFDKSTGLLPVHAIIKREDNSIFVTKAVEKADLFVNGLPVSTLREIRPTDIVACGNIEMRLEVVE